MAAIPSRVSLKPAVNARLVNVAAGNIAQGLSQLHRQGLESAVKATNEIAGNVQRALEPVITPIITIRNQVDDVYQGVMTIPGEIARVATGQSNSQQTARNQQAYDQLKNVTSGNKTQAPAAVRPEGFTAGQAISSLVPVVGGIKIAEMVTASRPGAKLVQESAEFLLQHVPARISIGGGKAAAAGGAGTVVANSTALNTGAAAITAGSLAVGEIGNPGGEDYGNLYKYWQDRGKSGKNNRYQHPKDWEPGSAQAAGFPDNPVPLKTIVQRPTVTPSPLATVPARIQVSSPELPVQQNPTGNRYPAITQGQTGMVNVTRNDQTNETEYSSGYGSPTQYNDAPGYMLAAVPAHITVTDYGYGNPDPVDYDPRYRGVVLNLNETPTEDVYEEETPVRDVYEFPFVFPPVTIPQRPSRRERIRLDIDLPKSVRRRSKKSGKSTGRTSGEVITPLPWLGEIVIPAASAKTRTVAPKSLLLQVPKQIKV
jgi:hypothetical protein